jgi:serine/threonine protein kinase
VQGGELFGRLQNSPTPGRIRPEEARFYAACVVDSFEYLHSLHIVYRDLKVRAGRWVASSARVRGSHSFHH